jgi:hypothetical protein
VKSNYEKGNSPYSYTDLPSREEPAVHAKQKDRHAPDDDDDDY